MPVPFFLFFGHQRPWAYMPRIGNVYTSWDAASRRRWNGMAKKGDDKDRKDSQLILRLDKKQRDEFVKLCKDMDTTAAREIRHFIRKFLKENG